MTDARRRIPLDETGPNDPRKIRLAEAQRRLAARARASTPLDEAGPNDPRKIRLAKSQRSMELRARERAKRRPIV